MSRLRMLCWLSALTSVLAFSSNLGGQQPGVVEGTAEETRAAPAETVDIAPLLEAARAAELAGDNDERARLLVEAHALAGTSNETLNRMRGLVLEKGYWLRPEEAGELSTRDPLLADYREQRRNGSDTLEGNVALAEWCESAGLAEQARAHWQRALEFDMENTAVRARLGHVNVAGRWVTPDQLAASNEQATAAGERWNRHQAEAVAIGRLLDSPRKKKRDEGLAELNAIEDPEWVTALELVLAPLNERAAAAVVDKLASFEEREATHALMRIAVYSPWNSARELAATRLGSRDRYDYVPELIALLATPADSRFAIQTDASGGLLYQHLFVQQTADMDVVRQSDNAVVNVDAVRGRQADPLQTLSAISAAGRRALQLENLKEQYNRGVDQQNRVVTEMLSRALELDLGDDPAAWWSWWHEENEVYVRERPVSYRLEQSLDVIRSPRQRQDPIGTGRLGGSCECLVAGTKIWTESGLVAVEKLTVGDRVLARNVTTGELRFRPVIRPTIRPTSPTLRISLDGEVIQASGGHPFWVSGTGWVKARDLKAEMRLQTVDGVAEVKSVESGEAVELYNLIVEADSSYFVGDLGILSHDNTIPSRGSKTLQNRASR